MSLITQLFQSFEPLLQAIQERSFGYFLNANMGGTFQISIPIVAAIGLLLAFLGCYLIRPILILGAGGATFYLVYAVADLSAILTPLLPTQYHGLTMIILGALAALLAALLIGKLMRFLLPTVLVAALCLILYPILEGILSPALAFAAIAVLLLFLIPTIVLLHPSPALAILITALLGGYVTAFAVGGLIPLPFGAVTLLLAGVLAIIGIVLQALLTAKQGYSKRVFGRSYCW